jgi:hypothetical protein
MEIKGFTQSARRKKTQRAQRKYDRLGYFIKLNGI